MTQKKDEIKLHKIEDEEQDQSTSASQTGMLAAFIFTQNLKREIYFPAEILQPPFWDIMQFLYINEKPDKLIAEATLLAGIDVERSIGLRCLNALVKRGYILKSADKAIGTGYYYQLARPTRQKITSWLKECIAKSPDL